MDRTFRRWWGNMQITIRPSTTISKVSTYALRWSVCDRKHAFVHRSHVDKVIRFTQNLSPHTVRFDGRVLGNRLVHRHHGLERMVFFTHHRHRFAHSHGHQGGRMTKRKDTTRAGAQESTRGPSRLTKNVTFSPPTPSIERNRPTALTVRPLGGDAV